MSASLDFLSTLLPSALPLDPPLDVRPGDMTFDWAELFSCGDDPFQSSAALMMAPTATPGSGSNNSSPTDFAFAPPAEPFDAYRENAKPISMSPATQTPNSAMNPSFSINSSFSGVPPFFGTGSSFSSTSAGSAGGSFSSAELPPISHDFARPSTSETRRPATAGGALQSGWGMSAADRQRFGRSATATVEEKVATIDEETNSGFINPFASGSPQHDNDPNRMISPQAPSVDPHYNPAARRSSESQVPGSWGADMLNSSMSAPSHVTNFNVFNQANAMSNQTPYRPSMNVGRPQTSDGIPGFGGMHTNVSLPSARTIVNQIDYQQPAAAAQYKYSPAPQTSMPFRDARMASMPEMITHPPSAFPGNRAYSMDTKQPGLMRASYLGKGEGSDLTFVPLGGPAPKKRPRRRYDEIERLYHCGWNGCEKSYGTLNHLNAHVAMQKHGEKRLPQEFKEMRKAWRKKKREAAAQAANSQYMNSASLGWTQRASLSSSSESDYDRRDSSATMFSDRGSFYGVPTSSSGPFSWTGGDSRPGTSSSVASSVGAAPNYPQTYAQPSLQGVPAAARRPSAPQHVPMPLSQPTMGFRPNDGDHPTPTQQNPFPTQPMPGQPGQPGIPQRAFPFLTNPMTMSAGYPQQQFAFNR